MIAGRLGFVNNGVCSSFFVVPGILVGFIDLGTIAAIIRLSFYCVSRVEIDRANEITRDGVIFIAIAGVGAFNAQAEPGFMSSVLTRRR